jgi:tartrate dehydratase beta subunit/fumarate hydratase class I family protein
MKSEIRNLSKSDEVVLCGGTLDVARDNTIKVLSSILQFVKKSEHT